MHHVVNNIEATVINEILKRHIDTKVRDKEILNNMFKDAVDHIAIADVKKELSTSKYVLIKWIRLMILFVMYFTKK